LLAGTGRVAGGHWPRCWRALAALLAGAPQAAGAARFAHVPSRVVQAFAARLVARAQALGVRIIVRTVNDPTQMHRLLDLGMDGVITDRPDLPHEVLVARDQWVAPSPAPSPTTSERPS
jgi:glycerophosphoryl diester phosphodiesterase